jgi:hypothetical protein
MEEIKIIGDVLKIGVLYSPILFSNGLTSTQKNSRNKQAMLESRKQIFIVSPRFLNGLF